MKNIIQFVLCYFICSPVFGQTEVVKLKISHLTGDFYIYTTYNTYEGYRIPANGMFLVTSDGVVLFDTPWDTTQFQPLLDSIKQNHNANVIFCLATHWHSDRTEGLEYYRQKGIKTYTTSLTDDYCRKNNKKRAEFLITKDTVFTFEKYTFETYYPGEGHTADNIIVWFEKEKIVYGGCLIKGADAKNLGNMEDANIYEYEATLRNVEKKCKQPKFIIVSHSDWKNLNSLKHSISLAKKLKKKKGN